MSLEDRVSERVGNDGEASQYRARRDELDAADPHRPRYHFSPPGGLLHDPNGALYRDGGYHLFYQYWPPDVPRDRPWDEAMHWGHAVSEDLLRWHDLPIALAPDPGPEKSCFSGQALVEDDRAVLAYHGPGAGNCIATSDDDLLVDWEKHPDNPVIGSGEFDHRVFDPDIWREDGTYYALSGTFAGERFEDSRPVAFVYRSPDLAEWELVGRLLDDARLADPGEDAAVPNFFPLGDRHVLLCFSHHRGPYYYVGDYDPGTHTFDPAALNRLVHGPTTHQGSIGALDAGTLHAPSVLSDGDRTVAFFNVIAGRSTDDPAWEGAMSLPRVLSLGDDDRLRIEPIREVETLRTDTWTAGPRTLPRGEEVVLDAGGTELEVDAVIEPRDAETVTLRAHRAPDGTASTDVTYYPGTDACVLDAAGSATDADGNARPPEVAPLSLPADEPLRLRLFLDRGIVEAFPNRRGGLTARVYPDRESDGLSLLARGGDARLRSLSVHELAPAPFNRR